MRSTFEWLLPKPGEHEIRRPIAPGVVEVTTYNRGGLKAKESVLECLANGALALITIWLAARFDRGFGILWTLSVGTVAAFAPTKLGVLKFFKRRPPTQTVRYEGAEISPALLERFQRAEAEYLAVVREIESLAHKGVR